MIERIRTDKEFMRVPCTPVNDMTDTHMIVNDLVDTLMYGGASALGLAANQIGHQVRICVVRVSSQARHTVMINPVITRKYGGGGTAAEGCLSMPGSTVNMFRNKKIDVVYTNERGVERLQSFKGFIARVIQHEADHLDGKLMGDK